MYALDLHLDQHILKLGDAVISEKVLLLAATVDAVSGFDRVGLMHTFADKESGV